QIARLRQRLQKYYETEGGACTERFVIPLGSHELRVEHVAPSPREPVPTNEAAPRHWPWLWILGTICATLLAITAVFGLALYRERSKTGRPVQAPTRLWASFFGNGRPTRIVLPSPVFLSFPHSGMPSAIMMRDTKVNDFLATGESPAINAVQRIFGK